MREGTSEQGRGSGAISRRNNAWLAWSLWALSLFLTALGILFLSLNLSHPDVHVYDSWLQSSAPGGVFSTVGALVAYRRPEHPVGWLFCAVGVNNVFYKNHSFLCRHCYDLTYESQRGNAMYRALHKAQSIRERLGGSANMMKSFPEKPKGMHWKTYERLWWEHHEADMEQLTRMREWLDKLEKKVG